MHAKPTFLPGQHELARLDLPWKGRDPAEPLTKGGPSPAPFSFWDVPSTLRR